MTCIFATFAASWDLLAGYAGQVNFGHALFFGAGAYTSALLSLRLGCLAVDRGRHRRCWSPPLIGLCVGYLCLRLRGSYLSLATLAFPLIPSGSSSPSRTSPAESWVSRALQSLATSRIGNYYIAAISMLVLVFGLWAFADSRFGLSSTPSATTSWPRAPSGIDTTRYKMAVFGISAAAAGITGALYAHFMRGAGPSTLETALSFQVVIWGVFGGLATIYGPVTAVFLLYPLTEWLGSFSAFGELRLLIFAVIVLLVLLFMPRGLTPWIRDRIETRCPRCKQRNAGVARTSAVSAARSCTWRRRNRRSVAVRER